MHAVCVLLLIAIYCIFIIKRDQLFNVRVCAVHHKLGMFFLDAGDLSWPVSAQELPYPDGVDKYKLFAQFLLQGKVRSIILKSSH